MMILRASLGAWRKGRLLILPLLVFLAVTFVVPIGLTLFHSFEDREFADAFPGTAKALARWDGDSLPDEETARRFVSELAAASGTDALGRAAARLNTDIGGFRALLLKTARAAPSLRSASDVLAALRALDTRWSDRAYWAAMRRAVGPLTAYFVLAALDLRLDDDGQVARVAADRAIFIDVFLRTFWVCAVVTFFCLVLGYPVAYVLAASPPRRRNLLLILVLIPFWTPLLVRTMAWVVLLQSNGTVNDLLLRLNIVNAPLQLIYNRFGVCVAMVHTLLPFMILTLYSVMQGIGQAPVKAALSLGASPIGVFWRVYLPLTRAGVASGSLLVYILALGYYVTPQLVGGAGDQMVSYFIAFYTTTSLNWGLAGALSLLLLLAAALFYLLQLRVAGAEGRKRA